MAWGPGRTKYIFVFLKESLSPFALVALQPLWGREPWLRALKEQQKKLDFFIRSSESLGPGTLFGPSRPSLALSDLSRALGVLT